MELDSLQCHFHIEDREKVRRSPYVRKVLQYDISSGFIEYDGYFYIEESDLPLTYILHLGEREKSPYKIEDDRYYYNYVFEHLLQIEIYRRESFEDTSVISDDIDEEGEPMRICFFPTNRERIWFRILKNMKV